MQWLVATFGNLGCYRSHCNAEFLCVFSEVAETEIGKTSLLNAAFINEWKIQSLKIKM